MTPPPSTSGFGLLLLLVPIQWVITNKYKAVQATLMRDKDRRIKLVDEILGGIKVNSIVNFLHFFRS